MAFLSYILVGFVVLGCEVGLSLSQTQTNDGFDETLEMDKSELLGLFDVFGSLLEDKDWSKDHPSPCSDTPWPGVQCEVGEEEERPLFHVTKIHIGSDILNPPCKASASLSDSLLKLPYLKTLSIFNCFLTSNQTLSPSLWGSLASLEHLALVSNPALTGEIPSNLSNLAGLRVLSLSQNSLVGHVPRELREMALLEQLDLSYNNLTGRVPEEIGGFESLTILDLSRNSLEGQLPSSIGELHSLQKVDFGSNKLVGEIPSEIGNLKGLVLLDLSNNLLNGPIPETLSGLGDLEHFIADNNPLNTRVPQFLGHLTKLQTLSLSGCGLKGTIPFSLASLKHLSSLSLHNNSLVGTVPPSLGTIPSLDLLNLSNNKLSGELLLQPDFIERLGRRLDIRGNNGLCTSNVSFYLEAPICLNSTSDKAISWPHSNDNESQRIKSPESRLKEISTSVSFVKPYLISFSFVVASLMILSL